MKRKDVYTIKYSRKGYVLYENGIQIDVFTRALGFDSLSSVVEFLKKYDLYVYKNLDI